MITQFALKRVEDNEKGDVRPQTPIHFKRIPTPKKTVYVDHEECQGSNKRRRLGLGLNAVLQFGRIVLEDDRDGSWKETQTKLELVDKWTDDLRKEIQLEYLEASKNPTEDLELKSVGTNTIENKFNEPVLNDDEVVDNTKIDDEDINSAACTLDEDLNSIDFGDEVVDNTEIDDEDIISAAFTLDEDLNSIDFGDEVVENTDEDINSELPAFTLDEDVDNTNIGDEEINSEQPAISHDEQVAENPEADDIDPGCLFPHCLSCEEKHVKAVEIRCSCGYLYEVLNAGSDFYVRSNYNEIIYPVEGFSSMNEILIHCECKKVFVIKKVEKELLYAAYRT